MTDLDQWRARLSTGRAQLREAEDLTARTRWALDQADGQLADARRLGEEALVERAERERAAAEREHAAAVEQLPGLRGRLMDGLVDVVNGLHDAIGVGGEHEVELTGVDQAVPIVLFPVRLETRFAGPDEAPVLRVRIFPDDLHIDDHEPDLSQEEVTCGQDYWTAVRAGTAEAEAWSTLSARLGPYRALWVREQLQPTNDTGAPTFPDVTLRAGGTSRPPVARALPDLFLVRVRAGGWSTTVPGKAVADTLQVGLDLAGLTPTPEQPGGDPTVLGDDVLVLGEEARWLSDFTAAVEAGMAVEVPLPARTTQVTDVVVAGVCLSLTPDDAGALVHDLVDRHRVTHGAGFVAPGTPTNNLADSTSGWLSRPDPSRLDPATRPLAGADSNAALLARALGLDAGVLSGLVGATDRDSAESEVMSRALFEATWGPYLRTQAQPGFPLRLLPQVHGHVTGWVRGGGPLPTVRLGRQPYGVLPVQPRRTWKPDGDDTFTTWLAGYLPRVRQLWLSGRSAAPAGVAAYSHEPVSSHYRVRTSNASSARPLWTSLGLGDGGTDPAVQERRLVAELGLGEVLPTVVSQLFAKDPVDLWMPMSDDSDLDFLLVAPKPKEATSVLGLLLRNAALQMSTNLANEFLAPIQDLDLAGLAAAIQPSLELPGLAELAVSATPEITVAPMTTLSAKLSARTLDTDGVERSVEERVAETIDVNRVADLIEYNHADAFRTYRGAHDDLAAIPSERRARLAGEVLDCASHRYDAWVTSLASKRLSQLRAARPTGLQIGAWGVVQGVRRRTLPAVTGRDDLPEGTVQDSANRGFVLAPSLQQADVAGVLRAAWLAHGGAAGDAEAPFAVDLRSTRLRQSLTLADGMRNGQQLGALLGYLLERALHDASGGAAEVDWAVFELRRLFPLRVETGEDAGLPSERLVVDGWRVAQAAMADDPPGLDPLVDAVMTAMPPGLDRSAARQAVRSSIEGVVGALDGLMDLGLAESMHQLAGANFARASAATDMVGRAAVPPDAFDVSSTKRGGQGVDQRLVVAVGGDDRPAGYADDTPRARLTPEADAFVARRLGPLTGVTLRLLGDDGTVVGTCALADLGLAALDLAADAASDGSASPFPLLLARARAETGTPSGVIALDPESDSDLVDLLEHAARWHQALAGRRPLSHGTFRPRGVDPAAGEPATADDDGGALAAVLAIADALEAAPHDALLWWGIEPRLGQAEADKVVTRRLAEARAAADAESAARSLFGGDAVVTGAVTLHNRRPVDGRPDRARSLAGRADRMDPGHRPRTRRRPRSRRGAAARRPTRCRGGRRDRRPDPGHRTVGGAGVRRHSWPGPRGQLRRAPRRPGARDRPAGRHRARRVGRGGAREGRRRRDRGEPGLARLPCPQHRPARRTLRRAGALDPGVVVLGGRRGHRAGGVPARRPRRQPSGPRSAAGDLRLGVRRRREVARPAPSTRRLPDALRHQGRAVKKVYAFHRIEPVSREGDPGRGLAAPVHDPLWGLARQRQFGELAGEDTGSPVQVALRMRVDAVDGWRPSGDTDLLPYDPDAEVLEAVVAGEPAGPATSLRDRMDAGRRLAAQVPAGLLADLLTEMPLTVTATTPRLVRRAASTYPDGIEVAARVRAQSDADDAALAAALGTTTARVAPTRAALEEYAAWCATTFGTGPATWVAERLERRFELASGDRVVLTAPAHTREVVDVPDLDLTEAAAELTLQPGEPWLRRLPTRLQFPGMPNDRFWEFEDALLALHRIDAATHDLARLALVEFSSTYGNDWFTFPVPVDHGTVTTVPEVVVRDTFGVHELVPVADDTAWSMFEPDGPAGPPHLVVPSVTVGRLAGPVVEEVRFVRDENANLVWGLEALVTDEGGTTHDLVAEYTTAHAEQPDLPADAELLYRLMTDVP